MSMHAVTACHLQHVTTLAGRSGVSAVQSHGIASVYKTARHVLSEHVGGVKAPRLTRPAYISSCGASSKQHLAFSSSNYRIL